MQNKYTKVVDSASGCAMLIDVKLKMPEAIALGRLGGLAGTGHAKVRGDSLYYQRLSRKRMRKINRQKSRRNGQH